MGQNQPATSEFESSHLTRNLPHCSAIGEVQPLKGEGALGIRKPCLRIDRGDLPATPPPSFGEDWTTVPLEFKFEHPEADEEELKSTKPGPEIVGAEGIRRECTSVGDREISGQ